MSDDRFDKQLTEALRVLRPRRASKRAMTMRARVMAGDPTLSARERRAYTPAVTLLREQDALTRKLRTCRSCGKRFAATTSQVIGRAIDLGGPHGSAAYCGACYLKIPRGGKKRATLTLRCVLCGSPMAAAAHAARPVCDACDARAQQRAAGGKRRNDKPYTVSVMGAGWHVVARHATQDEAMADARTRAVRHIVRVLHRNEVVWSNSQPRGGKRRRTGGWDGGLSVELWHDNVWRDCGALFADEVEAMDHMARLAKMGTRSRMVRNGTVLLDSARRGGKRRFDPAQLAKGTAEELEHAATIKSIARKRPSVKQAAALIAKDHLREDPCYYDRLEAVAVPRRRKGLKAPRLKLYKRHGKLRIYIVDSNATRKRYYGDWVGGGHDLVYPDFVPPFEIWLAEELIGIERELYLLHEANERGLMARGMDYDTAHDKSTALEQSYRKTNGKGLKAAISAALRRAVSK